MTAKKKIRVYSNEHSVSHKTTLGNTWTWKKNPYEPECYLDIELETYNQEMRASVGFRRMFLDDATLFIKDADTIKLWGLQEVQEYILSVEEIKNLVVNGTMEELEDFLMYAPNSMLYSIEMVCTETEITDRRKLRMIRAYTGKDLEEFYADLEAEGKTVENFNKPKARQPRAKMQF